MLTCSSATRQAPFHAPQKIRCRDKYRAVEKAQPARALDFLRTVENDLASMEIISGLSGSDGLVVGEQHTAPSIGSGKVRVLATPVMINLIEAAALAAVEHLLPPGYQSLGTRLDVRHIAATPVGMRVTATAVVSKVDGRTIHFRVEARDEKELIGDGTHERVVVNVAKFDQRVQRKLSG